MHLCVYSISPNHIVFASIGITQAERWRIELLRGGVTGRVRHLVESGVIIENLNYQVVKTILRYMITIIGT